MADLIQKIKDGADEITTCNILAQLIQAAANADYRKGLYNAGALEVVASNLQEDKSANILLRAAALCIHITNDVDACSKLTELKAVDLLTNVVKKGQQCGNASMQQYALGALTNLIKNDPQAKEEVIMNDGLPFLLELLQTTKLTEVQKNIAAALALLAQNNDFVSEEVGRLGGLDTFVELLQNHESIDPNLTVRLLQAIWCCAYQDANVQKLHELGLPELLYVLVKHDNPNIQHVATKISQTISTGEEIAEALEEEEEEEDQPKADGAPKSDPVQKIVESLKSSSEKVVLDTLDVVWDKATNPSNRKLFVERGVITSVTECLKNEDADVLEKASGLLCNLAADELCRQNMSAIGTIPALMRLLNVPDEDVLLKNVIGALGNISFDVAAKHKMVSAGVLKQLFKLIERPKLSRSVAKIMISLATDDDCKNQARELGGLDKLVALLSNDSLKTQIKASCALWVLVNDDDNMQYVRDAGGLRQMALLLPQTDLTQTSKRLEDFKKKREIEAEVEEEAVAEEEGEVEEEIPAQETPTTSDDEGEVVNVVRSDKTVTIGESGSQVFDNRGIVIEKQVGGDRVIQLEPQQQIDLEPSEDTEEQPKDKSPAKVVEKKEEAPVPEKVQQPEAREIKLPVRHKPVRPTNSAPREVAPPKELTEEEKKKKEEAEKKAKELAEKEAKFAKHREHLVKELLETELSYVQSLKKCKEVYMEPLRGMKELLTPDKFNKIFSDLELIIFINSDFLKDLEAYFDKIAKKEKVVDSIEFVSELFVRRSPTFKLYSNYINNYDTAAATVETVNKNKAFHKFMDKCTITLQEQGQRVSNLESFLIMPIQRLPRYSLMLGDLLKHSLNTHPCYNLLEEALDKIKQITTYCNERKREMDNKQHVIKVAQEYNLKDFVSPSRMYIRDEVMKGSVLQIQPNKGSKRMSASPGKLTVMMFNDVLVVIKHGLMQSKTYEVHLDGSKIEDFMDDNSSSFMVESNDILLQLCCESPEQKNKMMKELKVLVQEINIRKRQSVAFK